MRKIEEVLAERAKKRREVILMRGNDLLLSSGLSGARIHLLLVDSIKRDSTPSTKKTLSTKGYDLLISVPFLSTLLAGSKENRFRRDRPRIDLGLSNGPCVK